MNLTTKQAIVSRRSIRKFKKDEISDEILFELIEAARLAPSGCNSQPWRFKIVKDKEIIKQLADSAYNQKFLYNAPVIIVCCFDIRGYLDGTVSGIQDLVNIEAIDDQTYKILEKKAEKNKKYKIEEISPGISFNVAIAIEHIVLRSLDFGLGTCWVRLFDSLKVKQIFNFDDNIEVVTLLPIGYPDENPEPRKRLKTQDLLL